MPISRRIAHSSIVVLAFAVISSAQQRDTRPEFEVASIKAGKPAIRGTQRDLRRYATRIDYSYVPIEYLIRQAYDLPLIGKAVEWPARLQDTEPQIYSISATFPAGTTEAQIRQMLQRLLEDRLALRSHRVKKETPGYEIRLAQGGFKLLKSKYEDPAEADGAIVEGRNRYSMPQGAESWRIRGVVTISNLVAQFGGQLGAPMVDRTGLTGYYDVDFTWKHPYAPLILPGQPPATGEASVPEQSKAATLIPAVEKELGLKINATKLTLDLLQIDGIEKVPTPN